MARGRYQLLAIDLDGTLLRSDGRVSPRNSAAVARAIDAGVEVVVATGRSWIESKAALDALPNVTRFIGAGGALLAEASTGKTLERNAMEENDVHAIVASLTEHGHLAHLLKDRSTAGYDYLVVGDGVLDRATDWWFRTLPVEVRWVGAMEDDPSPGETIRVGTVARRRATSHLADLLLRELGDAVHVQHWGALTEDDRDDDEPTHMLEVFNPDTDKWTMLMRYAARRGIDVDAIAVIGDGLNDIRMVREAGLGIAMANAEAGVLHVADMVVGSNDMNGVAEAIEHVLSVSRSD